MSQSARSTAVRRAHGVPVFVHAADAVRARTGEKPKVAVGPMCLGPTLGFFGHSIRKNGLRSRYVGEVTEIGDGDVLDLPGSPVIVGMPGHSPGSVAVHVPVADAVFVGDARRRARGSGLEVDRWRSQPDVLLLDGPFVAVIGLLPAFPNGDGERSPTIYPIKPSVIRPENRPTNLIITPRMRSFQRASAWLAAFVIGLPALGVVAVIVALRGRSWELFSAAYLVLFVLVYLAGLIVLALLRFRPDWLRALVAAVALYAIASVTPLTDAMIRYPYHVVRCGGLPVVGSFGAAPGYAVPGEEDYAVTPLDGSFFCTEKEAKDLGYYHDDF